MNNDTNMDTHCDSNKIKHETSNTWVISLPSRVTPTHSQNFFYVPEVPICGWVPGDEIPLIFIFKPTWLLVEPALCVSIHLKDRATDPPQLWTHRYISRIHPPVHLKDRSTSIPQGSIHQYTSKIEATVCLKDLPLATPQGSIHRHTTRIHPPIHFKDGPTGTPQGSSHQSKQLMEKTATSHPMYTCIHVCYIFWTAAAAAAVSAT